MTADGARNVILTVFDAALRMDRMQAPAGRSA
jgi:hypothetical protein